jgi:hypothetical protein
MSAADSAVLKMAGSSIEPANLKPSSADGSAREPMV